MGEFMEDQSALRRLRINIEEAQEQFLEILYKGYPGDSGWSIENCWLLALAILESLELDNLRSLLLEDYKRIKESGHGFGESGKDEDLDEVFPVHLARLRQYLYALEPFFAEDMQQTVMKDLLQILRGTQYTIADEKLFGSVPQSEDDVHRRIEGILKPVYPDLKHKPVLTKQITNFIPDTGIPSLKTLIEYKFLDDEKIAPRIANEIYADTRGYVSSEWGRFIYVIYETRRFKPEKDWNQLLREAKVPPNTIAIVISGEPPNPSR